MPLLNRLQNYLYFLELANPFLCFFLRAIFSSHAEFFVLCTRDARANIMGCFFCVVLRLLEVLHRGVR